MRLNQLPESDSPLGFLVPPVPSDSTLWCRVRARGICQGQCFAAMQEGEQKTHLGHGKREPGSKERLLLSAPPPPQHLQHHQDSVQSPKKLSHAADSAGYQHKDNPHLLFPFPTVLCVWFRWTAGLAVRQNNQHLCKYLGKLSTVSKVHCCLRHFDSKWFFLR